MSTNEEGEGSVRGMETSVGVLNDSFVGCTFTTECSFEFLNSLIASFFIIIQLLGLKLGHFTLYNTTQPVHEYRYSLSISPNGWYIQDKGLLLQEESRAKHREE